MTLFDLLARVLHVLVIECVAHGTQRLGLGATLYRLTAMPYGIDWYSDHQLIIWCQEFPGAELTPVSDITAPLMAHRR